VERDKKGKRKKADSEEKETKEERPALIAHKYSVKCVSFSPDGKLFVSGSEDYDIKIWDTKEVSLMITLRGHEGSVNSVMFSPDSSLIISGSDDKTIRIWHWADPECRKTLNHHTAGIKSVTSRPSLLKQSDAHTHPFYTNPVLLVSTLPFPAI